MSCYCHCCHLISFSLVVTIILTITVIVVVKYYDCYCITCIEIVTKSTRQQGVEMKQQNCFLVLKLIFQWLKLLL